MLSYLNAADSAISSAVPSTSIFVFSTVNVFCNYFHPCTCCSSSSSTLLLLLPSLSAIANTSITVAYAVSTIYFLFKILPSTQSSATISSVFAYTPNSVVAARSALSSAFTTTCVPQVMRILLSVLFFPLSSYFQLLQLQLSLTFLLLFSY